MKLKSSVVLFSVICLFVQNALANENEPISKDQIRSVEQTFLTYPEWYLVHSPSEYAVFVATHPAHEFPFIGHVSQLWSGYQSVTHEQYRANYPSNIGYHVMICVIATSTTIEYGIRWLYENTLGRISWMFSSGKLSQEDIYGAKVAQAYVDFIRKEPWYLFDFGSKLKGLWSTVPAWGPNMIRKWERRYALTTEYTIKLVYAKVIEFATRQAYDPALLTTQAVACHIPISLPSNVKLVKKLSDECAVLDMPRYYDFRIAATDLAKSGGQLTNIAGNTSVILVTVWVRSDAQFSYKESRILFEQPIMTVTNTKRVAVILPVKGLSDFLANAESLNLKVEHVYDY